MRNLSRIGVIAAAAVTGVLSIALLLGAGGAPARAGGFPPLTGAMANLPAAKAYPMQAQAAAAGSAPKASKADLSPITNQPGTAPVGGIENVPQGPFPYSVFAVQNSWGGMVGRQWLWVYAGQVGPDNQSAGPYGGVALFSQTVAGLDYGTGVASLGTVTIPGLTSALHITGVIAGDMTLADAAGNTYTFNLANQAFTG